MEKLTSRKFWICVAAFLGSVATSIAGLKTDNETVVIVGVVAGIFSAAIYAFCEAWVDSRAVNTNAMDILTTVLSNMNMPKNDDEEEG